MENIVAIFRLIWISKQPIPVAEVSSSRITL